MVRPRSLRRCAGVVFAAPCLRRPLPPPPASAGRSRATRWRWWSAPPSTSAQPASRSGASSPPRTTAIRQSDRPSPSDRRCRQSPSVRIFTCRRRRRRGRGQRPPAGIGPRSCWCGSARTSGGSVSGDVREVDGRASTLPARLRRCSRSSASRRWNTGAVAPPPACVTTSARSPVASTCRRRHCSCSARPTTSASRSRPCPRPTGHTAWSRSRRSRSRPSCRPVSTTTCRPRGLPDRRGDGTRRQLRADWRQSRQWRRLEDDGAVRARSDAAALGATRDARGVRHAPGRTADRRGEVLRLPPRRRDGDHPARVVGRSVYRPGVMLITRPRLPL